ncbi:hypothetical protein [Jhaorihella thermophila]|uniref:hypothetical protein n=1 Tax=Jhaorihella thermophila TaxID=488547 RepID=UPI0011B0962F|nr:hypothetical protein [Jhaorihella thermophila]
MSISAGSPSVSTRSSRREALVLGRAFGIDQRTGDAVELFGHAGAGRHVEPRPEGAQLGEAVDGAFLGAGILDQADAGQFQRGEFLGANGRGERVGMRRQMRRLRAVEVEPRDAVPVVQRIGQTQHELGGSRAQGSPT